jgi:iron complex outermembrane receptor protein
MAQPKFTLTYHVDPDALLYATFSTGFRSGGWNGPGSPIGEYGAEHVINYEAGFKTQWLDRKLTLNGDYFYAVDHDFQFFYVVASCGCQVISNLPSVHLSGVELELEAHPVAGFTLFGSVGTTHSVIADGGAIYAADNGNKTPKTIPFKINAGFQYQVAIAAGWEGLARLDYEHKDKEYWQVDNLNSQRRLDLLNARLGVSHGGYSLDLWARNLTNTQYYEDYNPKAWTGLPYDIGSRAEPRTYGVELRAKF